MKKLLLLLIFMFILPAAGSLLANEMDNRVREIAHQLRCPTCQALSVKESEAGLASNMKMKIRMMLEEGKTEEEVIQYFVDRYGEWILRSPQKSGFNMMLWGMPGVVALLGAGVVVLYVRSKSNNVTLTESSPISAEEQAEIEKDLNQMS